MASRVVEKWIEEKIEFDTMQEKEKYVESIKDKSQYEFPRGEDILIKGVWKVRLTVRHKIYEEK